MAKKDSEQKGEEKEVKSTGKTGNAGRQLGTRKELPPVSYLLAYGDPETAHLPKTWMELFGFPMALALVFFLSLLTFHYAPHALSMHKGFQLPEKNAPIVEPVTITKEPEPEIFEPVAVSTEPEAEPEAERTETEL
jgi:hypothetical protein